MSKWKSSFMISIIINILIFMGGAVYMNYFAAPSINQNREPIEMEIVSDSGEANNGPQISAPRPEKVEIPPMPTQEIVKEIIQSGVPINEIINTPPTENKAKTNSKAESMEIPHTEEHSNSSSNLNEVLPSKEDLSRNPVPLYIPEPDLPIIPSNQGTNRAVASFTIEVDGSTSEIEMVQSSGYGPVDSAIIDAISQWSFKPATNSEGQPITIRTKRGFQLNIQDK